MIKSRIRYLLILCAVMCWLAACTTSTYNEEHQEGLTVNYEQFAVTDPSEIGTYTFKIPQDEEELDISAEFPDGILYLTKVSRMEEKMKWGTDEDGKDLLKPQIYLTGRVEDKRSDRHVNLIQATDAKSETDGSGSHFYTGNYYPDIDQSESAS